MVIVQSIQSNIVQETSRVRTIEFQKSARWGCPSQRQGTLEPCVRNAENGSIRRAFCFWAFDQPDLGQWTRRGLVGKPLRRTRSLPCRDGTNPPVARGKHDDTGYVKRWPVD